MRILIGAALLALVLHEVNAAMVLRALQQEQLRFFLAALALYLASQAISAYRWRLLARGLGLDGRYLAYARWYAQGMLANLILPGVLGGDAVRAFELHRSGGDSQRALVSVGADRAVGLCVLLWIATIADCLPAVSAVTPKWMTESLFAASAASLASVPALRLLRTVLAGKELHAPMRRFASLSLVDELGTRPLLFAVGLSLGVHLAQITAQYLLARGVGVEVNVEFFFAFVPIANLLATIPISWAGLGVRELAYAKMFGKTAATGAGAVAMGLLWFATTLTAGALVAVGLVLGNLSRAFLPRNCD